ncbi:MAG: hypothetical protein JSV80_00040, partial [Acidobacteriota bacterium]
MLLCWISLAVAEEGMGRIEGRVTKDGESVIAMEIIVQELNLTEVTEEDGTFAFDEIPLDRYIMVLIRGDYTLIR